MKKPWLSRVKVYILKFKECKPSLAINKKTICDGGKFDK
tara:strand:+ start:323 stop:439 length:117 start_codon:yes stop_codon:yes gene_type:complete